MRYFSRLSTTRAIVQLSLFLLLIFGSEGEHSRTVIFVLTPALSPSLPKGLRGEGGILREREGGGLPRASLVVASADPSTNESFCFRRWRVPERLSFVTVQKRFYIRGT